MDLEFLDRVKRLTIIALYSDDYLMERLVLKGGNLLDVVYQVSARASVDIDFSMADEFEDVEELQGRIARVLTTTFETIEMVVFDVTVQERPRHLSAQLRDFWGGYDVFFKIINRDDHSRFGNDLDGLRRNAAKVGKNESTKFNVQISKHEFCKTKQAFRLDGYQIFVYPPLVLVCEKIRAICQQMPDYSALVSNNSTARARDFVDIHFVAERYAIKFDDKVFIESIREVFDAKRVPLKLIGKITDFRDFHRTDFVSVRDTVKPGVVLKEFDFYFDRLLERCECLKAFWDM